MRLVRLEAENIKRIKCISMEFGDGALQVISGRNAQGKTSALDAVWLALEYRAASKKTERVIRDGERRARVVLHFDEMTVTRSWTAKSNKSTLSVESAEGVKHKSPQKLLDRLLGPHSLDPLAFTRLSDKEQVDALLRIVELPFVPSELDEERREAYEERTRVNRELKALRSRLAAMPVPPGGLPGEEVSLADLLAERKEAERAHEDAEQVRCDSVSARCDADEAAAKVRDLEAQLAEAVLDLEAIEGEAADALARVAEIPDLPDIEEIDERLLALEETNAAVRSAAQRAEVAESVKRGSKLADELTDRIEDLDERKSSGLAGAEFPVRGLGFDDEGLVFNGIPFKQASAAEQLRVSLAMAMASDPTIRLLRIVDGSLLDSASMNYIAKVAEQNEFQVLCEVMDESGMKGFVMEDGEVVAVNRAPATQGATE